MAREEAPLHQLQSYLPPGAFDDVVHYLQQYKVQLTITRERKSVLGDYRNAHLDKGHRISVNGNLNPYAFLITLLHELAHLFTYERYGHRVVAHGKEWQQQFGLILAQFINKHVFPADIEKALVKSIHQPSASSCADIGLMRVLHRYDPAKEGMVLIENLPPGALFKIRGGRMFRKGERLRKRFKCEEIATQKMYLFSPVYEVVWVPPV